MMACLVVLSIDGTFQAAKHCNHHHDLLFLSLMAAASLSSSPITQVSQHAVPAHANLQPQLLTRLFLDLRGKRFEVDRETIMNLPESVLLCLFPNGLVLSRQSVALSDGGDGDEDEEVYGVDVSTRDHFSSKVASKVIPCSSTQNVSNMFLPFSEMRQRRSMARRRQQAFLVPSNICWTDRPHPILARLPRKTLYFPNKRLLSFVRSSNTSRYPLKTAPLLPIRMA